MAEEGQRHRLTDRQQRFVEEYLVDLSPGAAAIRAGYDGQGAARAGRRLRSLPRVAAAIEEAMVRRSQRLGITQDRVVTELARLAFADMRDFVEWDQDGVRLKPSRDLGPDQTACLAEIVESPGGKGLRIKLHGKTQALAALARHLGRDGREARDAVAGPCQVTVVTCAPEPDPPPDEAACASPFRPVFPRQP